MSYYYNYCLGYLKNGKVYPLGPFDAKGKIYYVLSRSRSFASNLHEDFYDLPKNMYSNELKKTFQYETWDGETEVNDLRYIQISELGSTNFIKTGYFLISDVEKYEKNDGDDYDLFWDNLSPAIYAAKLENELKFGAPKEQTDDYGEKYTPHSVADYMFYVYPDYNCREYETFLIKKQVEIYEVATLLEGAEVVVLLTEG